jgi:hypothetical protein
MFYFLIQDLALTIKDKAKCSCIQTLKKTELSQTGNQSIIVHLHKDMQVCLPENDHSNLSLPNATYYLQKRELDFAIEKGIHLYSR